jgi:hypothetical protein
MPGQQAGRCSRKNSALVAENQTAKEERLVCMDMPAWIF